MSCLRQPPQSCSDLLQSPNALGNLLNGINRFGHTCGEGQSGLLHTDNQIRLAVAGIPSAEIGFEFSELLPRMVDVIWILAVRFANRLSFGPKARLQAAGCSPLRSKPDSLREVVGRIANLRGAVSPARGTIRSQLVCIQYFEFVRTNQEVTT